MVLVKIDDDLAALMQALNVPIEPFTREVIVMELHRRAVISGGKAAELLRMDRLAYIQHASSLGIPYIDMTPEELEAEFRAADEITRSLRPSPNIDPSV